MAEQAGPSYVPDESGRRLAAVALAISAVALLMPAATAVAASPEPVDSCVKGVHAFGAQGTDDGAVDGKSETVQRTFDSIGVKAKKLYPVPYKAASLQPSSTFHSRYHAAVGRGATMLAELLSDHLNNCPAK
jgi:hypothetical protein